MASVIVFEKCRADSTKDIGNSNPLFRNKWGKKLTFNKRYVTPGHGKPYQKVNFVPIRHKMRLTFKDDVEVTLSPSWAKTSVCQFAG